MQRAARPAGVLARQLVRAIAQRAERAEGVSTESPEPHLATSVRFGSRLPSRPATYAAGDLAPAHLAHISGAMSPSRPSPETSRARSVDVEERSVSIPADGAVLSGDLVIPRNARGLVLFAHGSGSSRHSPRNRFVASELQSGRLATLLLDLLTPDEEALDARTAELRFDIALLARRLVAAVEWARAERATRDLRIGLFGASTGGGAALVAAALRPEAITAVVSRGGRPDLAGDALPAVRAATLLIVGGDDEPVIELNRQAMERMRAEVELEVVPGATHLFEEPGTLDEVARLARDMFAQRLGARSF